MRYGCAPFFNYTAPFSSIYCSKPPRRALGFVRLFHASAGSRGNGFCCVGAKALGVALFKAF